MPPEPPPAVVLILDGTPDAAARTRDRIGPAEEVAPADVERAVADAAPADVVLVRSGVVLPEGWLDRLRDAATSDTLVATASPVPLRSVAPGEAGLDAVAETVAQRSPRIRPRLTEMPDGCRYLRRPAIELVGLAPLEGFGDRCLEIGLQHVLADDVVAAGIAPLGEPERTTAAARTLRLARIATGRPSVTFDGRCLREDRVTGTEVHLLEAIGAVARTGEVDVRVLLPPDPGPRARSLIEGIAGVGILPYASLQDAPDRTDVVHRPYQVTSSEDLSILRLLGERLVITHQDLIAYRNPSYHASPAAWHGLRRLTRQALELADVVVFESAHTARDAAADDLVSPERVRVVPIGTDHQVVTAAAAPAPPPVKLPERFLLMLGADYRHKNHGFAARLLEVLRDGHGWDGDLVAAGPRVEHGGSQPSPGISLGPVGEPEKAWLIANAAAVLYPSTYEGFGLIPFEAAAAGTPCLWAPVTSLADWLPTERAPLVAWDAEASARRSAPLLVAGPERDEHVAAVREAGEQLTWERAAQGLLEVYAEAVALPARFDQKATVDALAAEMERGAWEGRYWHLRNQIGDTGLALVGPEEPLLPPDAQRALAALAGRPMTRGALLAALRAARRVAGG